MRGGDGNPPTTRETGARKASGGDEGRTGGLGTAAPPHPQWGTGEDGDSVGSMHRHTNSADGARPKNGMHTRRKYSLLAPTEPADNPSAAGNKVSGDGHKANRDTAGQTQRATDTGNGTGQRVLLARGMQEDTD